MRILFVCSEYPPAPHGGIGVFVFTLAHKMEELGHQVFVIGYDKTKVSSTVEDDKGVMVFRLASPYTKSKEIKISRFTFSARILLDRMYLSKQINELVSSQEIEIVESYDWSGPLWSKPNAPLVVRLHGANSANQFFEKKNQSRLLRFFERKNILMADYLIAVSDHIGKTTLEALNIKNKKYKLIYNGVDIQVFKNLKIQREKNQILFVGSVTRRKGIFQLFQAFNLVLQQMPETKLIVIGSLPMDEEQLLINDLLKIIPEDKRDNVNFLGRISHDLIPEYYNRASIAVFPSLAEAFGLTCVEAMACGTPVIMTDKASGPELIEHCYSGILVNVEDRVELSNQILHLLENSQIRKKLGSNAINRVEKKFDLRNRVQENIDFYYKFIYREVKE